MHKKHFLLLLLILMFSCKELKREDFKKNKRTFLKEQTLIGTPIWKYLRNNKYHIYSLSQDSFINKIDSLQSILTNHLKKNINKLDSITIKNETAGIKLAFDKLTLEYPELHKLYTNNDATLSKQNKSRQESNLKYFNDESLLSLKELKQYIETYIKIESDKKLRNKTYNSFDNQQLLSDWNIMESVFTNPKISDYWKHKYLYDHIDNFGIKNIDEIYLSFISTCTTPNYAESIRNIYNAHKKDRNSHLIKTYKEVDGFKLDMHLFLPNSTQIKEKRPVIVQFHGGSWSIGKPDWFFSTATSYAKQGWVVAVVEYRIKGKHNSYPFESVKDAKSAIRWIREKAPIYNIDPNKIVATGNSAGGHLCLATSLVDNWNEKTDNVKTSAKPNAIIVNSGVYDLTNLANKWIVENHQNKNVAQEISPNHLVKKSNVKMLLIHGDKDLNCPYENAKYFYNKMKSLGNNIEFHTVKEADHWIWFGKHSNEVERITNNFLNSLNF